MLKLLLDGLCPGGAGVVPPAETVEPGWTVATLEEPVSGTGSGSSRLLQPAGIDAATTSMKRNKALAFCSCWFIESARDRVDERTPTWSTSTRARVRRTFFGQTHSAASISSDLFFDMRKDNHSILPGYVKE